MLGPEDKAGEKIDAALEKAGCIVQSFKKGQATFSAGSLP
jgi:hypothetical protein